MVSFRWNIRCEENNKYKVILPIFETLFHFPNIDMTHTLQWRHFGWKLINPGREEGGGELTRSIKSAEMCTKMQNFNYSMKRRTLQTALCLPQGRINYIDTTAKCFYLKNLPVKRLFKQEFIRV